MSFQYGHFALTKLKVNKPSVVGLIFLVFFGLINQVRFDSGQNVTLVVKLHLGGVLKWTLGQLETRLPSG